MLSISRPIWVVAVAVVVVVVVVGAVVVVAVVVIVVVVKLSIDPRCSQRVHVDTILNERRSHAVGM